MFRFQKSAFFDTQICRFPNLLATTPVQSLWARKCYVYTTYKALISIRCGNLASISEHLTRWSSTPIGLELNGTQFLCDQRRCAKLILCASFRFAWNRVCRHPNMIAMAIAPLLYLYGCSQWWNFFFARALWGWYSKNCWYGSCKVLRRKCLHTGHHMQPTGNWDVPLFTYVWLRR